MAQTNVQAFSGDVQITSNLAVDTNTLFVDSVGNRVGIGLTTPESLLHVKGSGGARVAVESTSGFGGLEIGGTSGGLIDFKTPFSDDYDARIIYSGGNLQFTGADVLITENLDVTGTLITGGSVGIGTTNPGGLLQIYGDSSNYVKFNPTAANDTTIIDFSGFGATSFRPVYEHRHYNRAWFWGPVNANNGTFALAFSGGSGNDPDVVAVFDTNGKVHAGTFSGTATSADNVQVDRYDTGDTSCYLTFTNNNVAGKKRLYIDNNLVYDNTNNKLTATTFVGTLDGNARGLSGPIFYAYNNGNSNGGDFSIASGGRTTLISTFLTDTTINQGSRYYKSGTNKGRFIASVAGYYAFQGAVALNASSGVGILMFRKNGTTYMPAIDSNNLSISGYQLLTTYHLIQSSQVILYLAANDYIEMIVFSNGPGIIGGSYKNNFSNFSGYRLY